jgi:hypothetical protein
LQALVQQFEDRLFGLNLILHPFDYINTITQASFCHFLTCKQLQQHNPIAVYIILHSRFQCETVLCIHTGRNKSSQQACNTNVDRRKIIEPLSKPTARKTQQTLLEQTNKHLQQCSVCDPAKMSHIQLYFFPTPPIKLKVGLQNKWETTNSKPPGTIILIGQSETGSNRHIKIYYTLLWQVLGFSFYQPQHTAKMMAKSVLLSQTSMF